MMRFGPWSTALDTAKYLDLVDGESAVLEELQTLQNWARPGAGALVLPTSSMAMKQRNKPLITEQREHIEEARMSGRACLIAQVQTMVKESGNPEGFDAAKWVDRWIDKPLPALGGQRPGELMDTPDGRALVSNIVACMQSGAYL